MSIREVRPLWEWISRGILNGIELKLKLELGYRKIQPPNVCAILDVRSQWLGCCLATTTAMAKR